jgi:hypothetical protein
MTMTELLPALDELNRAEKLRVMHYLVTKLEKEENILPTGIYPVWTPFQSYEAANILMEAFIADQAEQA